MSYILIIGVFESVFLILLLLAKKKKTRPDLFLGLIFLLFALSIGTTFVQLYNTRNAYPFPFFLNIGWLLLFLHGPALWAYIKSLTLPDFRLKPVHLLHLLPFLAFLIIHYFDFLHLPAEERIRIVEQELFKDKLAYKISVLAVGISTLSYNIWALLLIHNYRLGLKQVFSKIEDKDLNWLRILTIASITVYAVNVALYNLDLIFHFAPYRMLLMLTYTFATVYVLFLGWFGLQQQNVFLSSGEDEKQLAKKTVEKTLPGPKNENEAFISRLMSFMEKRQAYLEPEISIGKLARMLEVRPQYLSDVLNNQLNQSFFEFINKYRVEEFKVQSAAASSSHLSIMGIAYNCGFNSKASFYRAFKKFTGMSPSAYMERVS